jgi:hypothetical protein
VDEVGKYSGEVRSDFGIVASDNIQECAINERVKQLPQWMRFGNN